MNSFSGRFPLFSFGLLWHKARKRLFGIESWVILVGDATLARSSAVGSSQVVVQWASEEDMGGIVEALPAELVGHMTRFDVRRMVAERFRDGVPCLVAKSDDLVVGGCWLANSSLDVQLRKLDIDVSKPGEIQMLFVSTEARGRGIGVLLCREAFSRCDDVGYGSCISLVWYSRKPSICAHLKAGFLPIGEKRTYSILGYRRSSFRLDHRLSNSFLKE